MAILSLVRWILVLPGAVVSSFLSAATFTFLARQQALFEGVGEGSFLGKGYVQALSAMAFGASFVFIGAWIAPSRRSLVAAFMGVLLSVVAVWLALYAVHDWWELFSDTCLVVGGLIAVYRARNSFVDSKND